MQSEKELLYEIIKQSVNMIELIDELEKTSYFKHNIKRHASHLMKECEKLCDQAFGDNKELQQVYEEDCQLEREIKKLPPSSRLAVRSFLTELNNITKQ